jgi:2,3-bisphosphoglycerate-independent phosphoglycerate mutase
MPDHPTPLKVRTHTSDPVPFCITASSGLFSEERKKYKAEAYSERNAASTGLYIDKAHTLIEIMIRGRIN